MLSARAAEPATPEATDEALMGGLGRGEQHALRALHHRHAALVFTVASRIVDAGAAEDVVQDVFVTLWKKHETFDPARGSFKGWLVQIARRRALNELRRKRGKPGPGKRGDEALAELPDDAPEPDEAQWLAHRTAVIRAAVDALPPAQRQALSLAFFDELTHEQIASVLQTPVGTTKTRIRLALKRLAPALLVVLAATAVVLVVRRREQSAARNEAALRMVTASDVVPLRLGAAPGVPADAHGSYRTRPGSSVAVLTTSHLPPLTGPEVYVAWARASGAGGAWHRLGPVVLEIDGRSLLVSDVLSPSPDQLLVTREPHSGGEDPAGTPVLRGPVE